MKRPTLGIVLVIALVAALALPIAAQEVVTVRIAFWGGDNDIDINNRLKEAFEAQYPNIKVELLHTPDAYDDKIRTMIVGGAAPDIIMLAESFGTYAKAGWLMPLDSLIANDPDFDLDDFFPLVVDAYRVDGQLYTLPMRWGPMILYYNKELFDQSAVAFPTTDWDWDAFLEAAKKLTRGEGPSKQFGIGSIGDWWPWWMAPIYQNGGAVLNEDHTETLMHQPEAIEALQWYQDLIWQHGISPNYVEWEYFPGKGPDQLFESGITAMNQTGFWAAYWLRLYNNFDWDVSVLPMRKRRATPLFSNGWAITSQSQHPKEAWELIKFLTSEYGQRLVAESGHDVPVRISVAQEYFINPDQPPLNAQLILEAAGHVFAPPVTERWNDMLGLMVPEIQKLLRNETTPQQAVATFKPAVDALLQEIAQ